MGGLSSQLMEAYMSSGSLCLSASSTSFFSSVFFSAGETEVVCGGIFVTFGITCTFGLDSVRFAALSFFAAFFFLEVSSLLTSSVIPQRSSRESCTPSECFIGRCGSISGFSSVGCGVTSSGFATVSEFVTFSICGCISGVETISPSVLLLCAG